jgi:hypothetical protein
MLTYSTTFGAVILITSRDSVIRVYRVATPVTLSHTIVAVSVAIVGNLITLYNINCA